MNQPDDPSAADDAKPEPNKQLPLFPGNADVRSSQKIGVQPVPIRPSSEFSKYVVYVDESGDHSLESVDGGYPVFVLAFCVFHKVHYAREVVPAVERFKFDHFGHDVVVLHETDIRKERGAFRFNNKEEKEAFLSELTGIIEAKNFILIACVIDKRRLRERGDNPYHIALGFCLETLYELVQEKQQGDLQTHVVVECRGKKEDRELELEFRRICDGANKTGKTLPFEVVFADKKTNSSGLQLADLVARPIGLSIVRPKQTNRAFDALTKKFYCSGGRENVGVGIDGWGLKIHPTPESERPR